MQLRKRKSSGRSATAEAEAAERDAKNAFDAAGAGGSFKVMHRNERGRLQYLNTIPASDLTHGNVEDVLKDLYGAGRFLVLPVNEDGRKSADGFEVDIYGDSKLKKKSRSSDNQVTRRSSAAVDEVKKELDETKRQLAGIQQQEREDRIVSTLRGEIQELRRSLEDSRRPNAFDSIIGNLDKVAMAVANFNNRETPAQMMQAVAQMVVSLKEVAGPDETERLAKLAELYSQMAQSIRPPVQTVGAVGGSGWTGGTGQFLGSFVAGYERYGGGALSKFLRGATGTPGPGAASAGQLLSQVPAGSMPANIVEGGFSGAPQQTAQTPEGQPQPQAETRAQKEIENALQNPTFAGLGVTPIILVRKMLASRHDPVEVGEVIVKSIEFMSNFVHPSSLVGGYIGQFCAYPASTFDKAVGFVPELSNASDEYLTELRSSVIGEVDNLMRRERWYQAHDGFPWEEQESGVGSEMEEDQASAAEEPEPLPEEIEGTSEEEPKIAEDPEADHELHVEEVRQSC